MKSTFLIVEDEPITARFISEIVEDQGYRVAGIAKSAAEARKFFTEHRIDAVLMDINIQGHEDGIQLARSLSEHKVAVIYLSAYNDMQTLNEAADTVPYGFLTKPFKEADLVAVLLVCVTRLKKEGAKIPASKAEETPGFGAYRLDFKENRLYYHDYFVALSKNEMRCLELFFSRPECVITIDEIRQAVWDGRSVGNSTIRELINRIRNKIEGLTIENIYGEGYVLKKQ